MKRTLVLTAAAAALAAATAAVAAQPAAPTAPRAAMTPAQRHDWERTHRVSRIIGSEVRDRAGERIGDIRDLVLDDRGTIRLAIVSTGGFLGVGDRLHAVPWEVLAPGPRDDRILDMDKARLKAAPGFDSRSWPDLDDARWLADNRRHYPH